MAAQSETLEGSLISDGNNGKDLVVGVLGSDLCTDAVCGNADVGFNGSIEWDKDVNPAIGFEGSRVVPSLEGKRENDEMVELKRLDEGKVVSEILEKEVMGDDVIQVESDEGKVGTSVNIDLVDEREIEDEEFNDVEQVKARDGKVGTSVKIDSLDEEEIEDEEFNDAEQVKPKDGKVVKCGSMKRSGKSYQASYELSTAKKEKFSVNDLVWGKVRSHPWWPGQIFDPSDSSEQAMKHFKKNCYLVAYYGDGTFAWNEASKLKSFMTHFSHIDKQKNSEPFRSAVDSALDEVKRRVEFGLACSCIPKDIYDKIKIQGIENCGIRQEPSLPRVDESLNVSSFSPEKLMEYLKALSTFQTGGFDRLELLIAKSQLLAFYRLKGYSDLPEFQYCRGLDNDVGTSINDTDKRLSEINEHAIHVSKIGDQTGTGDSKATNRSCRKRKHNLKAGVTPKKKILLEPANGTPDLTHGVYQNDDEAIANLISPVVSKKQKTIDSHYAGVLRMKGRKKTVSLEKCSNTTKQSFKIGECIRRVASQLTGPPSMFKYSGDRSQKADGNADSFSGNESDSISPNLEETRKSSLINPTEFSSLDDLLSLLQRVAQEPRGDYSFSNVIVSFFSDFRNSIILANGSEKESLPTNKVGSKRKKQPIGGSPETFDFDDLSDTYCTDRVTQNDSEEQRSQRSSKLDYQHTLSEPEKPVHIYTRRSNSKKQHLDSNHAEVSEKPSGYIDNKSPAELVLNFTELDSLPSETSLNNIFKHFGPLKESQTEIDRGSSRARVVFKKCADAEAAFSSAKKFNIFGRCLVDYRLNYSPSALLKASSFATTQNQELHPDLSNIELNTV